MIDCTWFKERIKVHMKKRQKEKLEKKAMLMAKNEYPNKRKVEKHKKTV
jgi:hypothetical protein